jgi:hypothetical protein
VGRALIEHGGGGVVVWLWAVRFCRRASTRDDKLFRIRHCVSRHSCSVDIFIYFLFSIVTH